jgi:hypothetical protein
MDGMMRIPATRYARIADGPASAVARPGSRKKPELNMAPVLIAYTSNNVSDFSSFFAFDAEDAAIMSQ